MDVALLEEFKELDQLVQDDHHVVQNKDHEETDYEVSKIVPRWRTQESTREADEGNAEEIEDSFIHDVLYVYQTVLPLPLRCSEAEHEQSCR